MMLMTEAPVELYDDVAVPAVATAAGEKLAYLNDVVEAPLWHIGTTKRQLSVTVDDKGVVRMTTVLGQSRTVTPYDYRMTASGEMSP